MSALKKSAETNGVSLDMEIALRLMTCMNAPELNKDGKLLSQIVHKDFSQDDAIAECKRNREHWLYVYEVEKLRLFLMFQTKMQRKIKEKFMVIDVKIETKRILAEMEANENANKKNKKGDE